jgi:long-chain acyl-CoA synthetase
MRVNRFWERLESGCDQTALIDSRTLEQHSYRSLAAAAYSAAERMRLPAKCVVFLYPERDAGGIACYLGALLAGHAVHLSSRKIDQHGTEELLRRYRPEIILWKSASPPPATHDAYAEGVSISGYRMMRRVRLEDPPPLENLAVLLGTSGTTGSAKFVRLSRDAISAAAEQVVTALAIGADDRAILSVPYSYVYGLSVVNSHLSAGGSLVLESRPAADPAFWAMLERTGTSTLPGVSITYQFMQLLKEERLLLPSLRKLTHSGEAANPAMVAWLQEFFGPRGVELFLMYGQTEASGRMTVLPPHLLSTKARSVGLPVQLGQVTVTREQEIVFSGPNVMLGYATCREDLCRGDDCLGVLHTGDLGRLDADGLLYVTGRLSRQCKIMGKRINLDDVEYYFRELSPVAAVDGGERIILFVEQIQRECRGRVQTFLSHARLPPSSLLVRPLRNLPRTESGKISYTTLASLLD